ncbi:methyl-accepting chemotaxis protein [Vibrio olivae]|uniref:Methyl-accepting chemotaxis protein n=1 Tax=Vibrio olivae TaxID=1243002 RepID=A0ABV5HMQ1_9VIBR
MFKKLSLKNKLALSASMAIIIGGVAVKVMAFNDSLQRMQYDVSKSLTSSLTSYNQYVSDWLLSKERALSSLSSQSEPSTIVTYLKQVKVSGAFDNVFVAYPDGSQQNANGVVLPSGNNDPRKWGWYINGSAMNGEIFMDNPTVAAATGANVVSLGKSIQLQGNKVVLGADVEITDIVKTMTQTILPGEGFMFIANRQGNVFTYRDASMLNQPTTKLGIRFADVQTAAKNASYVEVELNGEPTILMAKPIEGTELISVVAINRDSLVAPLYDGLIGQIVVTMVIVAICILLFNVLCNILFRPLNNVANALSQIASGDGDLTLRIEVESEDEVGRLAQSFNTFVGSLQQLIGRIRQQADELNHQADDSSQRANQAAQELNLQQQEVAMVATAVTEMASATQEIASHAEQTAHAAQESSQSTRSGHHLVVKTKESIHNLESEVRQASAVISDLDKHAQEISHVLATIQGVAEQTNLLALNAAIEAARAGEQGRGFAVVADEVRVLSQRTHASTEEIKSTIDVLQEITRKAVAFMESSSSLAQGSVEDADQATRALDEINQAVAVISDMATQIATAAEEQSHVTDEITQNVTSIKDVSDQLVSGSNQTQQQSEALKHQAAQLNQQVAAFNV